MRRVLLLAAALFCAAQAQWVHIARPGHDLDRLTHACVWDPVNDKIYMYGGTPTGNIGSFVTCFHRYDPIRDTWKRMADMNTARGWIKGVYCRGRLYALGGLNNSGSPTDVCEAYDIGTNTWSSIASLPVENCAYQAVVWRDSLIYVVGGYGGGSGLADVSIYSPATNSWTPGTPMPDRCDMGDACLIGDTIWFAGGYNRHTGRIDSVMRKGVINPSDPTSITWSRGPNLPCTTRFQGPTLALNDKVIFFGGYRTLTSGPPIVACWEYDPQSGVFDTLPQIPVACLGQCGVARESAWEIYLLSAWHPTSESCAFSKLHVGATQAVAEHSEPITERLRNPVTIFRGVLWLSPASSPRLRATCYLLDISGREVMELHPGANDVSRLAPGVYFVRGELLASSIKPQADADIRKVMILR